MAKKAALKQSKIRWLFEPEIPLKKSSFNFRQKFIESKSSRASCGLNIGHLSMTKLQQLLPSSSDPPVFATATKSTLK